MLKEIKGGITAPKGFKAAGVKAGIKKSGKEDVALIYSTVSASVAAMFTTNTMAAAPVIVSKRTVEKGKARAVIVNSGCANACTGEQGLVDARTMAHMTASLLNVQDDEVLVASTGIIGVNLPMGKVAEGIKKAVSSLSETGHDQAMQAIMTTDTFVKECSYEFMVDGVPVHIGAMAKGAGMIHPNMATMLAFITTDAAIAAPLLKQALVEASDLSFHMLSIDGDTSTNDMVTILANGLAENKPIDSADSESYKTFAAALKEVCIFLAKKIVHDGEGATKFIEINVNGAKSFADAKQAGMAVAKSPLVKTAFFGEDPNWGRILCAVGYSGIGAEPEKTSLAIGGITIVKEGLGASYNEPALRKVMAAQDIAIDINLGQGEAKATVWTCDFSYEYVKINGEYHT